MAQRLTENQRNVLASLRAREMFLLADATEQHWRRGETYYLDPRVKATGLRRAFARGNREALAWARSKRSRSDRGAKP